MPRPTEAKALVTVQREARRARGRCESCRPPGLEYAEAEPFKGMKSRRALATVVIAVGAMLLSGCIKEDIGVKVREDGSGTIRLKVVIDTKLAGSMGQMMGDMGGESADGSSGSSSAGGDPCAEMTSDMDASAMPEGAEVREIKEGSWCGVEITAAFESLDDFNTKFTDLSASANESSLGGSSSGSSESTDSSDTSGDSQFEPKLEKTADGGWKFSLDMADMCSSFTEDQGAASGMASMFLKDFELNFEADMPGHIVESNATKKSGGKSEWRFTYDGLASFCKGSEKVLSATNAPGGGASGSGGVMALGGAALIGIAAAGGVVALRRRRGAVAVGGEGSGASEWTAPVSRMSSSTAIGTRTSAAMTGLQARDPRPLDATVTPPPAQTYPPGWYQDPQNPALQRWWDGHQWTSHTHPPQA